ncbi:Hypothetical predicted protein [Lecanosticta acicola]|uniref:Uncharacterized protein n=1 Tax=Lecanosticta acicola TaxID=111012 RepID=A0AAI8Z1W5_9PEZI|nr:Hypothetical predicted protein [Lecanosticta acicola]
MPEASAEAQAQPLQHAASPTSQAGERPIDYELFGDGGTGDETGERHVLPGRSDSAPLNKGKPASRHKPSVGDTILEKLHFQLPRDRRCSIPEGHISPPVPGSGRRASTDHAFTIGGAKVETSSSSSSSGKREEVIEEGEGEGEGEASASRAGMTSRDLGAQDGSDTLYRCRDW